MALKKRTLMKSAMLKKTEMSSKLMVSTKPKMLPMKMEIKLLILQNYLKLPEPELRVMSDLLMNKKKLMKSKKLLTNELTTMAMSNI